MVNFRFGILDLGLAAILFWILDLGFWMLSYSTLKFHILGGRDAQPTRNA
jgi:hypothetical protein